MGEAYAGTKRDTLSRMRATMGILYYVMIIGPVLLSLLWARGAHGESGGVCFMFYLMADNDLESYLREDVEELMRSSAIRNKAMTTWVYIDQRNSFGSPISNLYNKDGTAVTGTKFSRSMYLTYDHTTSRMIVDAQSSTELDSDDYQTVYQFMTYAIQDCKSKGSTNFMSVFSSHGAGFYGFGGDENQRRRYRSLQKLHQHQTQQQEHDKKSLLVQPKVPSRRSLAQSNSDIAKAIELALNDHSIDRLDVLAFDACLMNSYVTAKEYKHVAKHLLASEATIPGHGWFFHKLTDVSSAVNVAKDIHTNFLTQKNKYWFHETPKTLALVDLDSFDSTFFTKMEAFASHMTTMLQYSGDVDFFVFLQRARAASLAFDSVIDTPGTRQPSAVDIGSFLEEFDEQCDPKDGTETRTLLDETKQAYDNMFIVRGNGPGTQPGTGMHIDFPSKEAYRSDPDTIKAYFLPNGGSSTDMWGFTTTYSYQSTFPDTVPSWSKFLSAFYTTTTPASGTGSVCSKGATSSTTTGGGGGTTTGGTDSTPTLSSSNSDRLLLNPQSRESSFGDDIWVMSELAVRTDAVTTDYGIVYVIPQSLAGSAEYYDLEPEVAPESEIIADAKETDSAADVKTVPAVDNDPVRRHLEPLLQHHKATTIDMNVQRRLEEDGYYVMTIYSGSIEGKYDGSSYVAKWGSTFIELVDRDTGVKSRSYVLGTLTGDMSIPVFYFPDGVTPDWSAGTITLDKAQNELGGQYAELSFGLSDVLENDPNAATNILASWWNAWYEEEEADTDGDASSSSKALTWLSLYGQGDDGSNVKRAIPRSEDGPEVIVPVMFFSISTTGSDGAAPESKGRTFTSLENVAFPWTTSSSLQPVPVDLDDYVRQEEASAAVLEMSAVDHDLMEEDPDRAIDYEQFYFAPDDEDEDSGFFDDFMDFLMSDGHSRFGRKQQLLYFQSIFLFGPLMLYLFV